MASLWVWNSNVFSQVDIYTLVLKLIDSCNASSMVLNSCLMYPIPVID
jgi:hypothetical protein